MSIINPVNKQEYTHYGWFFGCPIYIRDIGAEAPELVERNGIPEWCLDLAEGLFGLCIFIWTLIDDEAEPMYAIRVTGAIR